MATMTRLAKPSFTLYNHLMKVAGPQATTILGGSATPSLSVSDIISLSTQPEETQRILTNGLLEQPLGLASDLGSAALRKNIATMYASKSNITSDNVLVTNGTSGANHIVERSTLSAGDHVIVQYPIYGPSIEEPLAIGCSLSYLRGDPSKDWQIDLADLRRLIKPGKTKMLLLTNPGNPTGAFIDRETQREIILIAKEHDIVIHTDEIFRPLFHSPDLRADAPSFVEHADLKYDKVVVTGSMSKCYGLSGVRCGWITTPSSTLYDQFAAYRMFSVHSLSKLDETVAAEVLSQRCMPAIIEKHLQLVEQNLTLIEAFAEAHADVVQWTRPRAGAVTFIKILDRNTGAPVNDVDFCNHLLKSKGVLLSPGTPCFEFPDNGDKTSEEFRGRFRLHLTCPTAILKAGLQGLTEFLSESR